VDQFSITLSIPGPWIGAFANEKLLDWGAFLAANRHLRYLLGPAGSPALAYPHPDGDHLFAYSYAQPNQNFDPNPNAAPANRYRHFDSYADSPAADLYSHPQPHTNKDAAAPG
jgi:hypothetical protein